MSKWRINTGNYQYKKNLLENVIQWKIWLLTICCWMHFSFSKFTFDVKTFCSSSFFISNPFSSEISISRWRMRDLSLSIACSLSVDWIQNSFQIPSKVNIVTKHNKWTSIWTRQNMQWKSWISHITYILLLYVRCQFKCLHLGANTTISNDTRSMPSMQ